MAKHLRLFSNYIASNKSIKCEKILNRTYADHTVSKKTALFDFHVRNNGKIVDFAGFQLPVQYKDLSISASHLHTRKSASIFDVSHMLQTNIRGKDSIECFETLCPADLKALQPNTGTLTIFTTDQGTIYDDLIVTKVSPNHLYIVSNAAMRKQDMGIMENAVNSFRAKGKDVSIEFLTPDEQSLLAIQGPMAAKLVQTLIADCDLNTLYFMKTSVVEIAGVPGCRITRCGYTGEDGVEMSIPSNQATKICEALLATNKDDMKLAGLGARDSLRLEAGLCLYGADIDTTTTPIEAGLSWLIAKRRRTELNYPGASILQQQLKSLVKVQKKRIGFRMVEGPPARQGVGIRINDTLVGNVTSGCPSPSLGCNIGMGYVETAFSKPRTEVQLQVRDRVYNAVVASMPFVETKYFMHKSL